MDILLYLAIGASMVSLGADIWFLLMVRFKLGCLKDLAISNPPIILDVAVQPEAMFNAYLKKFEKHYQGEEWVRRFGIFKESLKTISRMNVESGATFGLTKFSDMAREELIQAGGGRAPGSCNLVYMPCGCASCRKEINYHYDKPVPAEFDWREKHYVGPVLDQKFCNGCWAFGIVETMETQAAIINGGYGPRLSVQELIDCSVPVTEGCENGNVVLALSWLCKKEWGIVTEEEYPLKDVTQVCQIFYPPPVGLQIKQFWRLCNMSEIRDMVRLLYFRAGPLIVVVNAASWPNYIDGVIQRACHRNEHTFDHVVQIVGYNLTAEVPYFIVRNSWGTDFGVGGYAKLAIGMNACGVADEVTVLDVHPFNRTGYGYF